MEQAKDFLTQFSGPEGYLFFFLTLIGCGMGLPMNSDLILIAASMLAAIGIFKLPILIPIAFLGLLTGDSINFFVARKFGPVLLRKAPFKWILSPSKVEQAKEFLDKRGSKFIFCIRFIPLIRTALFFTAGSLQIKPRIFYILNGASTMIYLTGLMNLSYQAGANIDLIIAGFKKFQLGILILVMTVMAFAVRANRKKRQISA
jgi:membrane protein DedA with SNARE-associated domain